MEGQDAAINEQNDRLVADILKKQNFNKGYQKADMVVRPTPADKRQREKGRIYEFNDGYQSQMLSKAPPSATKTKPPSFKASMLTSKRASVQSTAGGKKPVSTTE